MALNKTFKKRVNVFKKVTGFNPNEKNAIERGDELTFENSEGKLICIATNTANADENGVCSAHMFVKSFQSEVLNAC